MYIYCIAPHFHLAITEWRWILRVGGCTNTHRYTNYCYFCCWLLSVWFQENQEFYTQCMCGGVLSVHHSNTHYNTREYYLQWVECGIYSHGWERHGAHNSIDILYASKCIMGTFQLNAVFNVPAVRESVSVDGYVLFLLFSLSHNFTNENENLSFYCLEWCEETVRNKNDRKFRQYKKEIESKRPYTNTKYIVQLNLVGDSSLSLLHAHTRMNCVWVYTFGKYTNKVILREQLFDGKIFVCGLLFLLSMLLRPLFQLLLLLISAIYSCSFQCSHYDRFYSTYIHIIFELGFSSFHLWILTPISTFSVLFSYFFLRIFN